MNKKFRYFRVNPHMDLWKYISEIKELQKQGVLTELCPSPTYWEFHVVDYSKLPNNLIEAIIASGRYTK